MSDLGLYSDGDEEITRGLRGLYAAPTSHAYWNELESRIMARVASVEMAWWDEFDRWVRPGLAAAAVLIFAAGVMMYRTSEAEADTAYGELTPVTVPEQATARPMLQGDREAILRFVLSPPADTQRHP